MKGNQCLVITRLPKRQKLGINYYDIKTACVTMQKNKLPKANLSRQRSQF